MTMLSILAVGNIFRGDFGLFYQISRDVGALYPTTDVIDTYVYRGLQTGDMGITSAVGFFQSFVGVIMVCTTNAIVKKIEPDNAMF
jgi:putative aldouronate transport system permease protein